MFKRLLGLVRKWLGLVERPAGQVEIEKQKLDVSEGERVEVSERKEEALERGVSVSGRGVRHINVGIDFGTASTKVFLREIESSQSYACTFDNALEIFGPFCWPSTIAVVKGEVYFGARAESMRVDATIDSFKMCLGCQGGILRPETCPTRRCIAFGKTPGQFYLGGEASEGYTFRPWQLACLYLANLMGIIDQEFLNNDPFGKDCQVTYNAVAPLDMVEVQQIKGVFQRTLYIGYLLKDKVKQGIALQDAVDLLERTASEIDILPDEKERKTFIVPETHAAMVGYIISGRAEPGLYAAIDVGAGTTDVAIFRYCSPVGERDVAYYSAKTAPIGANEIDRAILSQLTAKYGTASGGHTIPVASVRFGKHSFREESGCSFDGYHLSAQEIVDAVQPPVESIRKHYGDTLGQGYAKEMRVPRWEHLNVVLLGGGNQLPFVRSQLKLTPREFVKHIHVKTVGLPDTVKVLGPGSGRDLQGYSSLLTIAHGLSFHIAENPDYFCPYEVEPLPVRQKILPECELPDNWWSGG